MKAVAASLGFILLLSGCAGASPQEKSLSTHAPAPEVDAESGSIAGLVTSDDLQPIVGADVALQTLRNVTVTDAAGRFTFNGVPPGDHVVFVQSLGYQSASKRVTILAGEVAEVKLTLASVALAQESYVQIHPSTFYMIIGFSDFLNFFHPTRAYTCDPCDTYQHITPGPAAVRLEADFVKSVPLPHPVICDTQGFYIKPNPTNGTAFVEGATVGYWTLAPRGSADWTEEQVTMVQKVKLTMTRIYAVGCVDFQQRVHLWMSMSYHGPFSEEFTALPPK